MRGTHRHYHPRPRMGGWSTWLHSRSTGDNYITCSHLMAREAGRGRAGGQPRPGHRSVSTGKQRMAFGGEPSLCLRAHVAVTLKWAYRIFLFFST